MSRDPFLLVAVLGAAAFAACSAANPPSSEDKALDAARSIVVRRVQTGATTVQLADMRVVEINGLTTVCGSVTTAPPFADGSLTRRFIVAGDSSLIEGDRFAGDFASAWREACVIGAVS